MLNYMLSELTFKITDKQTKCAKGFIYLEDLT